MARRYYRRRTVVVRPKKKWASNMTQGSLASGGPISILVENSVQTTSPTPVVIKTGNFKIQGDMSTSFSQAITSTPQMTIVVFFLPQGLTLDATTAAGVVENHPEWIMAWKQLDCTISGSAPNTIATAGFTFSSRLKRNLNSGDKICIGYVNDTAAASPTIKFTCQFWTCAN